MSKPKLYNLQLTRSELLSLQCALEKVLVADAQFVDLSTWEKLSLGQMKNLLRINLSCHTANNANSVLVEVRRKIGGR